MIKSLLKYTKTFDKFKKFLILRKYAKGFNKLSEIEKTVLLVEFLEVEGVVIIDALVYYNYNYPSASFRDKLSNLVLKEFYRIENNLTCTYVPF